MFSMANIDHIFEHLGICPHFASRAQFSAGQDQVIMALVINDNHIVYYHMGTQCSIWLG